MTDESDDYSGTGNSAASGWEQKRTHLLSTGDKIWDLAGNAWEHMAEDVNAAALTPALDAFAWREYNDPNYFPSTDTGNRTLFGPLNSSFSTAHGVGDFLGDNETTLIRGGGLAGGVRNGIFRAQVQTATVTTADRGFRCAALFQ